MIRLKVCCALLEFGGGGGGRLQYLKRTHSDTSTWEDLSVCLIFTFTFLTLKEHVKVYENYISCSSTAPSTFICIYIHWKPVRQTLDWPTGWFDVSELHLQHTWVLRTRQDCQKDKPKRFLNSESVPCLHSIELFLPQKLGLKLECQSILDSSCRERRHCG